MSQKVKEALQIFEEHQADRRMLLPKITTLTFYESSLFMDSIRRQNRVDDLIKKLLSVDTLVVNPERITQFWTKILWDKRIDFFLETMLYTLYASTNRGAVYYNGIVDIFDYSAVGIDCFIHETCHGFNEFHGGPMAIGVGWNEGSAIALAKYFCQEQVNLAETVFGTVLYYRDIGIEGYPRIVSIGDTNGYDKKGREFVSWLMRRDVSRVNWFDPQETDYVFRKYWEPLNRNVPWEEWLKLANAATDSGQR